MPKLEDLAVDEIVNGKVDARGRLYLGPDYADQEVKVATLEHDQ